MIAKPEVSEDDGFDIETLPELTPCQAKFVEELLAGRSASDAYRSAFSTENSQPSTIWAAASRMRHNANVDAWLTAARKANLGKGVATLEGHMSELERLREIALTTGNVGAAVQAEQLRGKASGYYKEQFEVVTHDPIKILEEISRVSPDIARKLAADANINWQPAIEHVEHG